MPQLISYRGRPVKRRRYFAGGLRLTFFASQRGRVGDQLVVTDDDWHRHGRVQFYPLGTLPDVRALAARATTS